ncbi:hypothetical protein CQW23_29194 [Capsicum baccatum]|uniref:Uncharacterized protein n=1 Tax=Capsicum baccatum TaxID=33114 RepID=A0A2G2VIS3_CAPBA|nr:hypothetical protein CQW23_29194 [Capsicum baccatum]
MRGITGRPLFLTSKKREEKRKEEEKNKRDKGRGDKSKKERRTEKDGNKAETYSFEEIKRSGTDRDKKHCKRQMSSFDDDAENEKDHSRCSYRHERDHKKLK